MGRTGRNTASGSWMAASRPEWPNAISPMREHRPAPSWFHRNEVERKADRLFQAAEARKPGSQKAEAGHAEGDRGNSPGLGGPTPSRGQGVRGRPEERPLYYFASLRTRHLSAFTADQHGSNLPAEHGPWAFDRTIVREGVWRHTAPRALVEARLEREGLYLWVLLPLTVPCPACSAWGLVRQKADLMMFTIEFIRIRAGDKAHATLDRVLQTATDLDTVKVR